jgi:hypothetical protein
MYYCYEKEVHAFSFTIFNMFILKKEPVLPEYDLDKMIPEFQKCLAILPTDDRPLVLVIDSLDQFTGEIIMDFLPLSLHKYFNPSSTQKNKLIFRKKLIDYCIDNSMPMA